MRRAFPILMRACDFLMKIMKDKDKGLDFFIKKRFSYKVMFYCHRGALFYIRFKEG